MGKDGSIESTTAVCGPILPPQRAANQNSNEGQPRVGELFFIHQEVDNHSLSSMSSDPTAYTETEIEENLTEYPLSVNYALGITAASAHSSVSSMSHDVQPKKFKSRGILTAFRRKALLSDRPENKVSEDKDAFPGDVPKTLFTDPAVNASTDPTIDIENQPSQEEESTNGSAADKGSVLSKAQSSMTSFSEGFGGYIYQNCSELNSRTLKLLIMTAAVLFLFGVSAVVAAFIVDGNPSKTEADNKQLTSSYESPTAETSSNSIESPQTTFESPIVSTPTSIAVDNATLQHANATTAPTTVQAVQTTDIGGAASNDVPLQWVLDITTSAATVSAPANLSATSITTPATASASTNLSTGSITNQEATALATTTATTPTPSTSTLSATYIQAIANSLLSVTLTNQRKQDKEDDKGNDKGNDKEDKGKNDETNNVVNVEQVVRFDITPMLNDPRGQPFKVLMRLKNKGNGNVSSDYLPKAGMWNCSPCEQEQISLENSVVVGTFDDGFLDMALAFSRGIFDNQMTFKLKSKEMLATPELVLLWVDGDVDDFAGMTAASLMESL